MILNKIRAQVIAGKIAAGTTSFFACWRRSFAQSSLHAIIFEGAKVFAMPFTRLIYYSMLFYLS